ncbi:MAG: hypothetical protein ACM3MI_15710 [Clostridiales bacterium]
MMNILLEVISDSSIRTPFSENSGLYKEIPRKFDYNLHLSDVFINSISTLFWG